MSTRTSGCLQKPLASFGGDGVAREFGHNNPAGTPSREHHTGEQGQRGDPHAEALGSLGRRSRCRGPFPRLAARRNG